MKNISRFDSSNQVLYNMQGDYNTLLNAKQVVSSGKSRNGYTGTFIKFNRTEKDKAHSIYATSKSTSSPANKLSSPLTKCKESLNASCLVKENQVVL